MLTVDTINVGLISNEIVDEPLDEMRYGFLTAPEFQDSGIKLDIIFDLLIPISHSQYVYTKCGNRYFIKDLSQQEYINNTDTILSLIQVSMEHARRIFIQHNPQYAHIEIHHFDPTYFSDELEEQLKEQKLK